MNVKLLWYDGIFFWGGGKKYDIIVNECKIIGKIILYV